MSRTWIVGMSGPGSIANLQAMWEPIKHAFSGIVWVLHDSRGSWEHSYLEEAKGAGEVIYRGVSVYNSRHDWCIPDIWDHLNILTTLVYT